MDAKKGVKKTVKSVKKIALGPLILIVLICIILFSLIVKLDDLDTEGNQTPSEKVKAKTQSMYTTSSISAGSDGTNRTI